jgi:exopolysaccharide biosynthesis protein
MVRADLRSAYIEAEMVHSTQFETPWSLVGKTQPIAAITGTFFAPQNGTPVADVLVHGELKAKGNRGSVLAVTEMGDVVIRDKGFKRQFDWTGYRHGLRGAVRLIQNGVVCPNPRAQSFQDPAIWGRAARTGVGITDDGRLVFVATAAPVTLSDLGRAMKQQGVIDAVSLDGGGSTMLYYNGKMVVPTKRRLTTLFTIKPTGWAHQTRGLQVQ